MNIARIIVLGIAVVAAGLAAWLVNSMSSSKGPAVAAQEMPAVIRTTQVLVASRPINVGERLTEEDFGWQAWPEEVAHPSFIIRRGDNDPSKDWIGAVMRQPVVNGEPMTGHKMVKIGEGGLMSAILEPGMRAIGVKISAVAGAGGFILPNDRVDVLVTRKFRADGTRGEAFDTQTILKNVRVLAIDQTFREEDGQQVVVGRTATLELSGIDAEDLALAANAGEVSLALRSLAGDEGENLEAAKARKKDRQVAIIRNARM